MTIPLTDLEQHDPAIRSEIEQAIAEVFDDGRFVLGPAVGRFETAFAAHCGAAHCIGVGSGTDALNLIFRALDIGFFEEVIVPAWMPVESAMGVSQSGAMPVLVDVRREDGLIDPEQIRRAITPETRAILAVHLFGRCADMDAINAIAAEHDLTVIEDATHAQGATYRGRPAGTLGAAAAFSFAPDCSLGAYGAAGAVTTSKANLADRVRMLSNMGSRKPQQHDEMGFDSRLDTIHAAVLEVKLKHLDWWSALRRMHASAYHELLAFRSDVVLPGDVEAESQHGWHRYVVRVADRDTIRTNLEQHGIEAAAPCPAPLHKLRAYGTLMPGNRTLHEAEAWARESLCLPIYPELTPAQRFEVVDQVRPARAVDAA